MAGLLFERVKCWMRRHHTFAVRFRDNAEGRPVMGYICLDCLHWQRSPLARKDAA